MSESLRNAYIWRWLNPLALRKLQVLMTVCVMLPSFNVLYVNMFLICYAVVLYYIRDIGVNFVFSYWCCKHFPLKHHFWNTFRNYPKYVYKHSKSLWQISSLHTNLLILLCPSLIESFLHYLPGFLIELASGTTSAASRLFTAHQKQKI